MPKKIMAHANERIDLGDFLRAANDYTKESVAFNVERSVLDRRSRVLDGFRVEIADQTSNPGQITIYNGNAFDRDGVHLNNEEQANAAKTITLSGASQTFYIEIEFTETESDSDSRAFWDPTFDQTAPTPDGKEFSINATTRKTPDWQIVTPVSTAGFDAATNPDSTKVPLMVLVTDGSNIIDTTAPGSGFTQVFASTVLESDVSSGVAEIRVLDARLFPDTGTFNLDVGGASAEGPFTITSVDRVNGIIQFAGGPTASAHLAGAIVRMASGVAQFVPERVAATESLTSPTQPDVSRRLYQADEVRGSGLAASKETYGDRDDTQIRSLKDHVDFLSAQIRELKFGALRPDDISEAPPATFSATPRYYEPAGGVQGARHHTVSIGNGTTSFGDFNGTDETPFVAAMAALPASGGTVYVKAGTYTFSASLSITKPVRFIGESGAAAVVLAVGAIAAPLMTTSSNGDSIGFSHMQLSQAAASTDTLISVSADSTILTMHDVTLTGNIDVVAGVGNVTLFFDRVVQIAKTGGGSVAAINSLSSRLISGTIRDSLISSTIIDGFRGTFSDFQIVGSRILGGTVGEACFHVLSSSGRISIRDSRVQGSQVFTYTGTPTVDTLVIDNVELVGHAATSGLGLLEFYALEDSKISRLRVPASVLTFSGTTSGSPGAIIRVDNSGDAIHITDCEVICDGTDFINVVDVTTAVSTNYGQVWVSNCYFKDFFTGVKQRGTGDVHVVDSVLETDTSNSSIGVEIGVAGVGGRFTIANNTIHVGNGASAKCVSLVGTGAAIWEGTISDNQFSGGDSISTSSTCYGVEVIDAVLNIVISGNIFRNLSSATGAICHGVSLTGRILSNGQLSVVNNQFNAIGDVNSNEAIAIYINSSDSLYNTHVCNNVIADVNSTGNWPAIEVTVANHIYNLQVSRNTIVDSGGTGTGTAVGLIDITQTDTTTREVEHIHVCDNDMNHTGQGGNGGVFMHLANTTVARFIEVSGNSFQASATSERGIFLSSASSQPSYFGVNVSENVLDDFASTLGGLRGCIELTDGLFSRVNVSNNVIRESTFDDSRLGIYIIGAAGGGSQVTVNANTLVGQSGTRLTPNDAAGIHVENCDGISITSNLVEWTVENSGSFHGIRITDCLGGVISGNYVLPDAGAAAEIFADGGSTDRLHASGNVVGNSVNNGTISLAGANSTTVTVTGDFANKLD